MKTKRHSHYRFLLGLGLYFCLANIAPAQDDGNYTTNIYVTVRLKAGVGSTNAGGSALALGINSTASGDNSTVVGPNASASGQYGLALGANASATLYSSAAMGVGATATGDNEYSYAVGYQASCNEGGLACGYYANDSGFSSIALGYDAMAPGSIANSVGYYTSGYGDYSTAIGSNSTAGGDYSMALGDNATSSAFASAVIGYNNLVRSGQSQYTWSDCDELFVVGNGANTTAPSNALVVQKDGDVGLETSNNTLTNTLTVNGTLQLNNGNNSVLLDGTGNFSASRRQGDLSMGIFGNSTLGD